MNLDLKDELPERDEIANDSDCAENEMQQPYILRIVCVSSWYHIAQV